MKKGKTMDDHDILIELQRDICWIKKMVTLFQRIANLQQASAGEKGTGE